MLCVEVLEDEKVSLSSRVWKVRESVSGGRKKGGFRLKWAVTYRDNDERGENKINTLPWRKRREGTVLRKRRHGSSL